MARRPRILVLNQYYWPGLEATAVLLTELCEYLALHYDVTVMPGLVGEPPTPAGETERNGVRIVRVRSTSFERTRLSLRGVNYLTYLGMSGLAGARAPRPDVVLAMTDPPIIGAVAVAMGGRFGVPTVTIHQDVFPEIAVELGRLTNPAILGALTLANRWALRRSTRVVAIGETMRERLIAKGARPDRVVVIPNWANADALTPMPRRNEWSAEQGLDDKLVVMHSGNVGYAQDLDSLIRASTFLRDRDDVAFVVIGAGARLDEVRALAERLEADVRFLPYQPRSVLPLSLSAADLHVVGLARGLSGFVVPSRLYGVLAVGRPAIVAADADSESAQLVERGGCGVVVPPGRPDLLAQTIRRAADGELDLAGMGRRSRELVDGQGGFERSAERYLELIDGLTGRRSESVRIAA